MQADAARAPRLATSLTSVPLRRLHSLAGVFPVGVFLVLHIGIQARGVPGDRALARFSSWLDHWPFLGALQLFGIVLPLSFHALYGIRLALASDPRSDAARDRRSRDALGTAQRVSGVVALLFIAYHGWELWAQKLLGRIGPDAFAPLLASRLSSTEGGVPVEAVVYLFGISATVFHFTNGLFRFSRSLGFFLDKRRKRALSIAFAALGVVIFLLAATTTIYFATGLRLPPQGPDTSVTDPWCSVIDPRASPPAPFEKRTR
jgi:succinate dehydrogenase/fumarate reductase cytochrome b subunit (b558 family)